jgi:hypothetical protein
LVDVTFAFLSKDFINLNPFYEIRLKSFFDIKIKLNLSFIFFDRRDPKNEFKERDIINSGSIEFELNPYTEISLKNLIKDNSFLLQNDTNFSNEILIEILYVKDESTNIKFDLPLTFPTLITPLSTNPIYLTSKFIEGNVSDFEYKISYQDYKYHDLYRDLLEFNTKVPLFKGNLTNFYCFLNVNRNPKTDKLSYLDVFTNIDKEDIIASNFYNNPSSKLKLVGVTGTNGKTTTATLLHQLFRDLDGIDVERLCCEAFSLMIKLKPSDLAMGHKEKFKIE